MKWVGLLVFIWEVACSVGIWPELGNVATESGSPAVTCDGELLVSGGMPESAS